MISSISERHVDLDFPYALSREEHAKRWKQRGNQKEFEDMEQFLKKQEQQGLLVEGAGVSHQPADTRNVNGMLRHVEAYLFPYIPYNNFGGCYPQRNVVMELVRFGVEHEMEARIVHLRNNVDFGFPHPVIPVENKKVYAPSECHLEDPNQPTPHQPRSEHEIAELFEQLIQSLNNNENKYKIIQKYIVFNKSTIEKKLFYDEAHPLNRYFVKLSPVHHQLLYATIVKHAPQYEIAFLQQCHPKALTCNMSQPELVAWLQHIMQLKKSPYEDFSPRHILAGIQDTSEEFLQLLINFVADEKYSSYLKRQLLHLVSQSILMNTSLLMGTMLKSEFLSGHADVDFFEKLLKFGTLLKTHIKHCVPSSDYKKWKRNMLFELCSAHAQKVCIGWKNLPHYEKLRKEHPGFHNQFMALKKLFN